MTTLAKDKGRTYQLDDLRQATIPIIANDIVYAGAAVGESSSDGTARPLVGGDTFLGFCYEKTDNTGGSAEAKRVPVYSKGYVWLTVTGGDNINDLGVDVYATDDDTFTLTASGASAIGTIVQYDSVRGQCLVYFEANQVRSI